MGSSSGWPSLQWHCDWGKQRFGNYDIGFLSFSKKLAYRYNGPSERQRALENSRLSELAAGDRRVRYAEDDLNGAGAGVGSIPPPIPGQIRVLLGFASQLSPSPNLLTDDAQRNLTGSTEYQELLDQLNMVAGNVIANSTQFEYREGCLVDPDAAAVLAFDSLPSPAWKRNVRQNDSQSPSGKTTLGDLAADISR